MPKYPKSRLVCAYANMGNNLPGKLIKMSTNHAENADRSTITHNRSENTECSPYHQTFRPP